MIARHRGFTLVEIMVGLAVGMISMIVIFQVYASFHSQKRDTTSGSDAQGNAAMAMFYMEREIRVAGNGLTEGEPQKYPPIVGCQTLVYDNGGSYLIPNALSEVASTLVNAGTPSSIRFTPAVVTDGLSGRPDSLTIVYGTGMVAAPFTLSSGYSAGNNTIALTNTAGIKNKDMVVLIEKDADLALSPSGNYITPRKCTLLQVTADPAVNSVSVAPGTQYNKSGGIVPLQPAYSDEARLHVLRQVNVVTYRILNNNLVAETTKFGLTSKGDPVTNRTDSTPLASNIVNMQIQYGIDTTNPASVRSNCNLNKPGIVLTDQDADGAIDAWVDPTAATQWENNGTTKPSLFDLRRVRAVRIGLVARSAVKQHPKPGDPEFPNYPQCSATTNPVTINWSSGPSMAPNLALDPDWQCYRYKVFQTTIPIRNTLWSSTLNPASGANCGVRELG